MVSVFQGLKFLGFVLSLDEKLTSTLHGVIKEHLPSVNRWDEHLFFLTGFSKI